MGGMTCVLLPARGPDPSPKGPFLQRQKPVSTLLIRFEIGDDRPHVPRFEGELGHVRMYDKQALRQSFCKSLDRISARERSKRRCLRMRAQSGRAGGMA